MFNYKEKTYAVLEFTTIDGFFSSIELKEGKTEVRLGFPTVIEVAAVKISGGKIIGHYSTFIGIDGCNPNDIRLDSDSPELYGITAEHLIGVPSLYDVCDNLLNNVNGCTLITRFPEKDSRNPLHIVKRYMEPAGYVYNNPVVSINNIITAIMIKKILVADRAELSGTDAYCLALSLENKDCYNDLVAQYLDCDAESGRQDCLSRALIMARLFIALSKQPTKLQPVDSEAPF